MICIAVATRIVRSPARRARRLAEHPVVGRQHAPAENDLSFLDDDALDELTQLFALAGALRQENEPGAVRPGGRKGDAERRRHLAQKTVGHLNQDARAVAGVHIAPARATVLQVLEDPQPLRHDVVRGAPLDMDDEPDAARVMLVPRVATSAPGGVAR